VYYDEPGTYNVTLEVSNPDGTDVLLKSSYISVDDALLPEPEFTASDSVSCSGAFSISFFDESDNCPTSWEWSFDPDDVTYINNTNEFTQNPEVEFLNAGQYSVTLNVSNNAGSNSITKEDFVMIGGFAVPYSENFENVIYDDMMWRIVNEDGLNKWEEYYFESDDNTAMMMKNYGYIAIGLRDQLISPPVNLYGLDQAYLMFKHAYAQRFTQVDSLIIYISDNCGDSWTRIFQAGPDGSGIFATSPTNNSSFIPASGDDWCGSGYGADCFTIDISPWAGMTDIRFMFENYNGFGNNLFIDDVLVDNFINVGQTIATDSEFAIFPNPSDGSFNVYLNELNSLSTLKVYDVQGRLINDQQILPGKDVIIMINIPGNSKGIFIVEFTNNDISLTKKIVVQ